MTRSNTISGAICFEGNVVSETIVVSGNTHLHVSGVTGNYARLDSEPYKITLHRVK